MYNLYLDIFHNFYTLIFSYQIIKLIYPVIKIGYILPTQINIFNDVYEISFYYFTISTFLNILDYNHLYVLHHLISFFAINYARLTLEPKYIFWVYQNFLSELSTVILSIIFLLKIVSNNYVKLNPKIFLILKTLFFCIYTLVRIVYLLPINIKFILEYEFNTNLLETYLLYPSIWFMIGLNIYWFFYVIKKATDELLKKNN